MGRKEEGWRVEGREANRRAQSVLRKNEAKMG